MFLEIYLGILAAMLTASLINVSIIKYNHYRALKRQQLATILSQQHQQNSGVVIKQPTLQ